MSISKDQSSKEGKDGVMSVLTVGEDRRDRHNFGIHIWEGRLHRKQKLNAFGRQLLRSGIAIEDSR